MPAVTARTKKGRCNQELDKNQALLSLTSFSNLYSDTGLFGLYAQAEGQDVAEIVKSMNTIFKEKPSAEGTISHDF